MLFLNGHLLTQVLPAEDEKVPEVMGEMGKAKKVGNVLLPAPATLLWVQAVPVAEVGEELKEVKAKQKEEKDDLLSQKVSFCYCLFFILTMCRFATLKS